MLVGREAVEARILTFEQLVIGEDDASRGGSRDSPPGGELAPQVLDFVDDLPAVFLLRDRRWVGGHATRIRWTTVRDVINCAARAMCGVVRDV